MKLHDFIRFVAAFVFVQYDSDAEVLPGVTSVLYQPGCVLQHEYNVNNNMVTTSDTNNAGDSSLSSASC